MTPSISLRCWLKKSAHLRASATVSMAPVGFRLGRQDQAAMAGLLDLRQQLFAAARASSAEKHRGCQRSRQR